MDWPYVGRKHWISPSLTCSLGCYMNTHVDPAQHTLHKYNNPQRQLQYTVNGMLKGVDGSFEVPTAEVVTPDLLLSIGGSPCDFTLAPTQTPPHTKPSPPPASHDIPHIAPHTSRLFLAPTSPDTFL